MDNKPSFFKKTMLLLGVMSSSLIFAQTATVTVDASSEEGDISILGKCNSWRRDVMNAGDLAVIEQQSWEIYRTEVDLRDVHNWNANTYNFPALYPYLDQASANSNSLMVILKNVYSRFERGAISRPELLNRQITMLSHYKERYPKIEWIEASNEIISEGVDRYYAIYTVAYEVVNAVNAMGLPGPILKLGGPVDASFNEPRLDAFLDRFEADSNPAKRLDFISYHQYLFGTSNKTNPARVRLEKGKTQNKLSARGLDPNIPVMISETGILATSTTSADFGGTGDLDDDLLIQVAAMASIHYWYLSGANPQDVYPFHWTLKHKNPRKDQFVDNRSGITTPYYNMIKMQQMLSNTRVSASSNQLTSNGMGVYGLASKSSSSVEIMTWNYQFSGTTSYTTTINVNNLPSAFDGKDIDVKRYHIDRNTSNYRAGTHQLELIENTTVSHAGSYDKTITLDANAADLIVLTPGSSASSQLIFEVESLNRTSNASTSVSGNGNYVNLDASGTGDWVEFTMPNVAAGTYTIDVNLVKFNNGGEAQSSLGGTNQGSVFDGYTGSTSADPFTIGTRTFNTTSNKKIRFTVTGKNSASPGFKIGIDKVILTPTGVENLGFEEGNFSGWTTTGTTSVVNNNQKSGNHAAYVGTASAYGQVEQTLTGLSPNTTYQLSAWVKCAGGRMFVRAKDFGGPGVSQSTDSTSYTNLVLAFTTGPGNTTATISAWSSSSTANSHGYFDDFELIEVPFDISNPGFETGNFTGWSTTGDATVVSNNQNSGSHAAYVGTASSYGEIEQVVTGLSPNTSYTLSGWVKCSGGKMFLRAKDFGGSNVMQSTTNTNYTQLSLNFTTGSSNTSMTIVGWSSSGTPDSHGFFDDFELTASSQTGARLASANPGNVPGDPGPLGPGLREIRIYPVPASKHLSLSASVKYDQEAFMTITDLGGKIVFHNSTQLNQGLNQLEIPVNSLKDGAYILQILGSKIDFRQLFIVRH